LKKTLPTGFVAESATARSFPPSQIVGKTNEPIPHRFWDIFINHYMTTRLEDAFDFAQQESGVLSVM